MFSLPRSIVSRLRVWTRSAALVAVSLFLFAPAASAQSGPVPETRGRVLTSFDDVWQLSEAEQNEWHRVRLEFVVYYYDALWQAMWGRCGEAESYLSLGTRVFPIKAGQKILVEGTMRPVRGMRVEEAKVTILEEAVPLEPTPTKGAIGNTELFNKRLVTVEGFVDRQVSRDANPVEVHMIVENRAVLAQLLLKNDVPAPQLRDTFVRAKGVYFARADDGKTGPKIELWVQQVEDVEVLLSLEQDERFEVAVTPFDQLGAVPPEQAVHVAGVVKAQQPGKSLTLATAGGVVVVQSLQTRSLPLGEQVNAIGYPAVEGGLRVMRGGLFRLARPVITSVAQFWSLPESERQHWHRVNIDLLVYYYDPAWKALWGRSAGRDDFLSLGSEVFPIKSGQRILIEGSVLPAGGMSVSQPKVTVLEESVPLQPVPTTGEIGDTEKFNKCFVSVEGCVDRQTNNDARHLQLDLTVQGRTVIARVLLPAGFAAPKWEGAILRVKGVYHATEDPTGALPGIELWTPGPENIEVLGWLDQDPRFNEPPTPIEKIGTLPPGTRVHIAGAARGQQPGKLLTVRDETGQINLHTAQTRPVQLGDAVQAIGVVATEGLETSLHDALYRRSQLAPPAPVSVLHKLSIAAPNLYLAAEEGDSSYPLQISGVVTWARTDAD
ncbi:MAG TPA: hypothetical protein VEQ65_00770, partial [Opitutus sp.]|nr:hypothetical protein [Opitutus sp.]